jgi:hypothetical protein
MVQRKRKKGRREMNMQISSRYIGERTEDKCTERERERCSHETRDEWKRRRKDRIVFLDQTNIHSFSSRLKLDRHVHNTIEEGNDDFEIERKKRAI